MFSVALPGYQSYRPASTNNMRSANQPLSIPYNNSGVQTTMLFNHNISQMSPLTQQTTARSQKKERKKALKIVNPDTGEEVKFDEANQNSATNEKNEENEVIVAISAEIYRDKSPVVAVFGVATCYANVVDGWYSH